MKNRIKAAKKFKWNKLFKQWSKMSTKELIAAHRNIVISEKSPFEDIPLYDMTYASNIQSKFREMALVNQIAERIQKEFDLDEEWPIKICEAFSHKGEHKQFMGYFPFLAEHVEAYTELDIEAEETIGDVIKGDITKDGFGDANFLLALYYSIHYIYSNQSRYQTLVSTFRNIREQFEQRDEPCFALFSVGYKEGEDKHSTGDFFSNFDDDDEDEVVVQEIPPSLDSVWSTYMPELHFLDRRLGELFWVTNTKQDCNLLRQTFYDRFQGFLVTVDDKGEPMVLAAYRSKFEHRLVSYDLILSALQEAGFDDRSGKSGFIPIVCEDDWHQSSVAFCDGYTEKANKFLEEPTDILLYVNTRRNGR